jgi:hypothetical protein
LHRKIGGLRAFQNLVHVPGDLPVAILDVRPVVEETAGLYAFSGVKNGR